MEQDIAISGITVGRRFRRGMGDMDGLQKSIAEKKLLQAIGVTPKHELLFGRRRLEACKRLGWKKIPARIIDTDDFLGVEWAENMHREDFIVSERLAIAAEIEKREAKAAKERQGQAGPLAGRGKKRSGSGSLPEAVKHDTRDVAAKAVGMSGRTYEKAKAVIEAAKKAPKRFGDLKQQMDKTGNVSRAYGMIKERKGMAKTKGKAVKLSPDEIVRKACVLVDGLYRAVHDPDWERVPLDVFQRSVDRLYLLFHQR